MIIWGECMKKICFLIAVLYSGNALCNQLSFSEALRNVRNNCSGISDKLSDIKKMAGVGTAVSATGTLVGGGAVASGLVKNKFDKLSDNLEQQIERFKKLDVQLEPVVVNDIYVLQTELAELVKDEDLQTYLKSINPEEVDIESFNQAIKENGVVQQLEELKQLSDEKSKSLGNVRTGLMAASTATNIASAVISGTNKIEGDFAAHIGACMGAVKVLSNAKMQAMLDNSATDAEITQANKIISACDKFNISDIEKINKRASGATVSSSIGAATGLAGTITSGVANSDNVRNSADNDKEKNLNKASNVLAGVTTAASLTATVFNATQISAAKRVIETAELCEEAIK